MEVDRAFDLISRAIDAGKVANGYLVVGDIRESCLDLANRVLARLYPGAEEQIAKRIHPDVAWLEPTGRSRRIKVARTREDSSPGVRDGLVEPMSVTSFSGGWKVGVVVGADRLMPEAANCFLKTLEEPPPHTLFLLLTDAAEAILPTIVSRCQRIDLPRTSGLLEGEAYSAVAKVLSAPFPDGAFERALAGRCLAEILAEAKDSVEPEEVPQIRKSFFLTLMSIVREWMIDGSVERHRAFRNVEGVEEAYRRCDRYLPEEAVICALMDKLAFPSK